MLSIVGGKMKAMWFTMACLWMALLLAGILGFWWKVNYFVREEQVFGFSDLSAVMKQTSATQVMKKFNLNHYCLDGNKLSFTTNQWQQYDVNIKSSPWSYCVYMDEVEGARFASGHMVGFFTQNKLVAQINEDLKEVDKQIARLVQSHQLDAYETTPRP